MSSGIFCKGYTWGYFAKPGEMSSKEGEYSMERLASNGLDWICIPVSGWQETYFSTRIFNLYGRTPSDEEVTFAINKAKSLGLKVCLKPMVNCLDGTWRARIDFPVDNRRYWDEWFRSYTNFMVYYAKMAEKLGCEMLCTGCEMKGMDAQANDCRKMIRAVREVYHGIVMHNVNHGDELRFSWLDEVDIIGTSAYFPLTKPGETGIEVMRGNWKGVIEELKACHDKYGKPVMFAEGGCRNEEGCSMYPWDYTERPEKANSEQEQADYYQTALEATWELDWFAGYFWWDWRAVLPPLEEMKRNRDFVVYGKLAEGVLKEWYTKER